MLQINRLRKTFGEIHAVDDVSFEVKAGEAFALLGPNGAGKTTTICMIVGLQDPDSGEVRLNTDQDPKRPATRKSIGIAPQKLSLYDDLTGKENLDFFGQMYGLGGSHLKERIRWCLDFAGLTDRAHHRVKAYSGGMQRRLNLAVALIHQPQLLLLDEPTVGVDPQSRNHLLQNIEQLKQDGITIIYTTHYMEEAQRLCDRIAIMDHGQVKAIDRVESLLEQFGGESLITVQLVHSPSPEQVHELSGELNGQTLRFPALEPAEQLTRLIQLGIEFEKIQITKPDLESVFLNLTGRSLRDE